MPRPHRRWGREVATPHHTTPYHTQRSCIQYSTQCPITSPFHSQEHARKKISTNKVSTLPASETIRRRHLRVVLVSKHVKICPPPPGPPYPLTSLRYQALVFPKEFSATYLLRPATYFDRAAGRNTGTGGHALEGIRWCWRWACSEWAWDGRAWRFVCHGFVGVGVWIRGERC